ncbi:MAG: sensor histidine kinase [Acidimicrobiales bacterium]
MSSPNGGSLGTRGGWLGGGGGPARLQVRSRIALITALAVSVAVILVSASAYVVFRHDLLTTVDSSLVSQAGTLDNARTQGGLAFALEDLFRPASLLAGKPAEQVVEANGVVVAPSHSSPQLPVSARVRAVAAGKAGRYFISTRIGSIPVRELVTGFGKGLALELVQPYGVLNSELKRLAAVLAAAATAGVVLALLLGAAVAGLVLRPVGRLTNAAEHLATTREFGTRIPVEGRDELSRLAVSLNTLLAALQSSQLAQRQLIADASHELRTPLTSLRTNVEILAGGVEIDSEARTQLVKDVIEQLDGLGRLVGDLIELARQEGTAELSQQTEVVALHEVVTEVLGDMRRDLHVNIEESLAPVFVRGLRNDLARVVANLVGNATKWSPQGAVIEVKLCAGSTAVLSVTDKGRGIAAEDLPYIFDRFYRGSMERKVPGSGLGLAIVRRIVEVHGGEVGVTSSLEEGSCFEVRLPTVGP